MDIEHELRAMDQARLTTDGIHFDSIKGQAWLNRVFQERLDELEVELFDTGVLKKEETASEPVISTFVPPNLETRLGRVPAMTYRPQSSSEPRQRTDVQDRLGEAPIRRTIHPRRRLVPVNPIYKQDLMKLNLQTKRFAADVKRMLSVDWLIVAGLNFSSTTALRFADLEGLPSNNTMGPVSARPLQDVKLNHDEGNREERRGKFLTTRAPIGQHVKMFRQIRAPVGHVKDRAYPKQVTQEGNVQRYDGMKTIRKDETIFAAYDKAEMRKAKIMIVANSDFKHTSKSLFWPDIIMLAAVDLDLTQSVSMTIGVQRQAEMNPITIVFADMNDHLHSRGFLSRLREPTTAKDAVWPAIKDILESMSEVVDTLKEGAFSKITPRAVFALSPGWTEACKRDGSVALGREILCDHICPKSQNRDGEPKTT